MLLRGKLLPFIGKAIAVVIVASVPWYFVAPAYNRLLATVSEKLIPSQLTLIPQHGTIYIYSQIYVEPVGGIFASALHYGLLLVVALIAVTPNLKLTQRLKYIGIAIISMFGIHVITIVLFVNAAVSSGASSMRQNPLIIFFTILGCDLFPALIWGVVAFRHFLPEPRGSPVQARQKTIEARKRRK